MKIGMGFWLLVGASVLPRMASAQSSVEPAREPAAEAAPTAAAAPPPVEAAALGKAPGDGASFVDRDGDGIQDGREHRFRKHGKGVLGHGAGGKGTGTGAMRRFRGGSGEGGPGQGGGR